MSAVLLPFRPRPGKRWIGGVHVARCGGFDLIAGPCAEQQLSWPDALAWAAKVCAFGRRDFSLPTVDEMVLVARAFPRFFSDGRAYWTSEDLSELPSCAWVAHFVFGEIVHWQKKFCLDAIAVRRHEHSEAA